MDDPNVILRLTALTQPAEYAFRLKQNQSRHVEPPPHSEDMRESFSRESTASEWQDDGNTDDYSSQLLWTFDQKLKNDQQRLTFGSEPHRCDVFLGRHKMIGGLHFYITLDREKGVVVYDVSKNGMSVTYDGKAGLPRHKFRWILFHGYKIVVAINENLRFRVEVPSYAICKPEYDANVGDFLQRSQSDDLLFGQLRITSQDNTANPTQSLSPRRRPIYLRKRQIGRGEHGTVHEVVNVSSGVTYAAKSFKPGFDFVKEVEILKSLSHERILQYVDFSDELPTPFLVTPFMPYGNLNENQGISSISVLLQVLEALEYLHANGVVHRDIKPANILVQSRTNLKLGDFGLAQNNSTFKTFCGTPKYCAPEITKEEMLYDPKVDIWSLGVVVFERSYDCPERPKDLPHRRWCRKIIKAVEDQEDDPVIVLLTRMLKIRPEDRLSASDCLTESDHLRLKQFESPAFDDGNITPTQSTMLGASWTPTEILASSVILRAVRASQDHERVPTDNEDAQPEIYNPRLDTTYSSHRGEVPESRMTKRPRLFHERPVGDTVYLNRSNWSLADIPEGWTPTSTGRDAYGSPKPSSHLSRTPEDSNVHPPWDRQAGRGEVNKPSLMLQKTVVECENYFRLQFNGRHVSLRKSDYALAATEMAVMAGKSAYQRQTIFARFKTVQKHRGTGSWITFEEGKQLCDELGLTTTLQPLFDLGQRLNRLAQQKPYQDQQQQSCKDQEQQSSQDQEQQSCQDQEQQSCQGPSIISRSDSFVPVRIGEKVVMIRERDLKINATHILNVAGLGRRKLTAWRKDLQNLEIVRGYGPVQGTYVDYQVGLRLCHQHRLKKLEQRLRCSLRTLESYPGGPVQDQPAIQYLTGSRPLGPSAFSSDLSRDPALPERSEHDLAEGLLDQRYIHNASSRSLMHSAPGNERGFLPQECSGSVVGHVEDSKHSSLDSWLDRGAVLGEGSQSSTRSDSTSQGSRETSVSVDSLNLEDLNAEAVERSLTDSWLHGRSITRSTNSLAHIKGRQDARSEITEPSFRNGSFVPPLKDSFLLPGA